MDSNKDVQVSGPQMIHLPSSSPSSTPSQHAISAPHTPATTGTQQQHPLHKQQHPLSKQSSSGLPNHLDPSNTGSPASVSSTPSTNNNTSPQNDTANSSVPAATAAAAGQSELPPLPPGATERIPPKSTLIKTDKPRPHVCTICTRSFARLEHLKRHERSHTKEKPFQCPVCERCFARRDLLLRHRQKLHASFPQETPRARGGNKRKSVSAASTGPGITTKTNAGVTKGSAAGAGAVNAAAAVAAVNGNGTPTATNAVSANSKGRKANTATSSDGNSPLNASTSATNTPASVSPGSMGMDFNKGNSANSGSGVSPFQSQPSPFGAQNGHTPNNYNVQFLLHNMVTPQPSGSSSSPPNDMQSSEMLPLSTAFSSVSDGLENNYGDFYGLLNSASPSALGGLAPPTSSGQYSGNSSENNGNNNNDTLMSSSIAAAAASATQNFMEASNRPSSRLDSSGSAGSRSRRNRPASFSATSATSYSKYKDIAQMDTSMNMPADTPTQVGFATPQLIPKNMSDNDADIGSDDLFNPMDPLFINPQLIDPTFDSDFFLSNSFQNAPDGQQGHHDTKISNSQENLSPAPNSLLELDNTDLSWIYPTGENKAGNNPSMDPLSTTNEFNNFSFNGDRNNPNGNATRSGGQENYNGRNKILSQMARGSLANTNSSNGASASRNDQNNANAQSNNNVFGMSPTSQHANPDWSFNGSGRSNSVDSFGNQSINGNNQRSRASGPPSLFANSNPNSSRSNGYGFNGGNAMNDHGPGIMDRNSQDSTHNSPHRITPQLRMHITNTLSTPTPFTSIQSQNLPSTKELQLYVDAYVSNFGKHLPFLHQTLEFNEENIALALGMAAIGALYLFERAQSAAIFEISRCCVHVYLESRRERKTESEQDHETTPLWLVQALLLGVIYGLFNEELLANEIAVAQADAVISLAKSAGLHLPPRNFIPVPDASRSSVNEKWHYFILVQERIRTMHVVHTISCLLATGYNVTTKLKNSDIRCGSPCDENLWQATSAGNWWTVLQQKEKDGSLNNAVEGPDFIDCLNRLLAGNTLVGEVPHFTLLTLIYAIHFDIHERRVEHDRFLLQNPSITNGKQGTSLFEKKSSNESEANTLTITEIHWLEQEKQRTEAILRAWETTWSLSPHASLIPKTADGSLISDSIPMSSLAHVRLYLDLRKAKECFWKRDFAAMGHELDILATPVLSEVKNSGGRKKFDALLEAASYAADTISLWEKHAARWSLQMTALETFIHNTMALFDCGLIVSEFFHRLEKRDTNNWQEEERLLVKRLTKIFFRVFDVLFLRPENDVLHNQQQRTNGMGMDETNGNASMVMMMMMNDVNMNGNMPMLNNSMMGMGGAGPNVMMMMMQQQIPMSIIALTAVSRILSTIFIWPFALVMSQALRARIMQIRSESPSNNGVSIDNPMNGMNQANVAGMNGMGFGGMSPMHTGQMNQANIGGNMRGMSPMGNVNNMPLNAANVANLMNQLGMSNVNNMNVNQIATLLNQMKQMGMLGNGDGSNSMGVNPIAFMQQQLNLMNQNNGSSNNPNASDSNLPTPNFNSNNTAGNNHGPTNDQTNINGSNMLHPSPHPSAISPLSQMSPPSTMTPTPNSDGAQHRNSISSPMNNR